MPHPIQPFIILESFNCDENENDPDNDPKIEKIINSINDLDLSKSAVLIFVSRRKDCHRISDYLNKKAKTNSKLSEVRSYPFHAGLSEGIKVETCELLKNHYANILVCTKAFGMGMDIPHIHQCFHYRPPTYIEDYLQEVGRIGRSKKSRLDANKDQIEGLLLFNSDDFDRNISRLHENTIRPYDLLSFKKECIKKAQEFSTVKKYIANIPMSFESDKKFDEKDVSTCLFWLERAKELKIEGTYPPCVDLTIDQEKLSKVINGNKNNTTRLAAVLLEITDESKKSINNHKSQQNDDAAISSFRRLIRGMTQGIIAMIYSGNNEDQDNDNVSDNQILDVSISISQIVESIENLTIDEVYIELFNLVKCDCISIHKEFIFNRFSNQSSDYYWSLLEYVITRIIKSTDGNLEIFNSKDFENECINWYSNHIKNSLSNSNSSSEEISKNIQKIEVYRAIKTTLKISRFVGVEIQQDLNKDGVIQYKKVISKQLYFNAKKSSQRYLNDLKILQELIKFKVEINNQIIISLKYLIDEWKTDLYISHLKKLLSLIDSSGLFGIENSFDVGCYIVSMNNLDDLPHENLKKMMIFN